MRKLPLASWTMVAVSLVAAGAGCASHVEAPAGRPTGKSGTAEGETRARRSPAPGVEVISSTLSLDDQLEARAEQRLDDELEVAPTLATWLGVHTHDDQLDDVRAETDAQQAARIATLHEWLVSLGDEPLSAERQVDRLTLERRLALAMFERSELRPFERNPVVYLQIVQGGLYGLVDEDATLPPERTRLLLARLRRVRPFLADARRNLRNTAPDLSVRRAIELGHQAREFFAESLPRAVALPDGKPLDDFRAAVADATHAIDEFLDWLQRDLQPRARGDFAIGKERLMERLRLQESIELSPEQLVALGERELRDARRRLDEAARSLLQLHTGVDLTRLIEDDHPRAEELLPTAQTLIDGLCEYCRVRSLLPPLQTRPRVQEMPPVLWGFVQLSIAGPLEARPRDPQLFVDPVDKAWPERRKLEHLRTVNRSMIEVALLEEITGQALLVERNRHAPTLTQKLAMAPMMILGWPHYIERVIVDAGWGGADPRLRVAVERSTLLRAARLVAVVRLHALGAKIDDATKIFTDEAYLDDYQARREAERAALDPLVLGDAIGRLELEKLRADLQDAHPQWTLADVHDAMLSHGTVPIAVLRKTLLPDGPHSSL